MVENGCIVILSPTGVPLLESAESPLRIKPTRPDTSGLNAVVGDVLGCDIFATQVYARCCHMWDLKKFLSDAPKPEGSNLNLYQQIAGYMKNGEFCVDATFVGYDMRLEGLIFLRKAKEYGQHKYAISNLEGNEFFVEPRRLGYTRTGRRRATRHSKNPERQQHYMGAIIGMGTAR